MGKFRDFMWAELNEMAVNDRSGVPIATKENIRLLMGHPKRHWAAILAKKYHSQFTNPDGSLKNLPSLQINMGRAINKWIWHSVGLPIGNLTKAGTPINPDEINPEMRARAAAITADQLVEDPNIQTFPKYGEQGEQSYDDPYAQHMALTNLGRNFGFKTEAEMDQFITDALERISRWPSYPSTEEERVQLVATAKNYILKNLKRFALPTGSRGALPPEKFNQLAAQGFISAYRNLKGFGKRNNVLPQRDTLRTKAPPPKAAPGMAFRKHDDLRNTVRNKLAALRGKPPVVEPQPPLPLWPHAPQPTPDELLQQWKDNQRKTG